MCKRSSFISNIKYILLCLMLDSTLPWHTQRSYKLSSEEKMILKQGRFTSPPLKSLSGIWLLPGFHFCQAQAVSALFHVQNRINFIGVLLRYPKWNHTVCQNIPSSKHANCLWPFVCLCGGCFPSCAANPNQCEARLLLALIIFKSHIHVFLL